MPEPKKKRENPATNEALATPRNAATPGIRDGRTAQRESNHGFRNNPATIGVPARGARAPLHFAIFRFYIDGACKIELLIETAGSLTAPIPVHDIARWKEVL
jgi:hypothetical protein